jgi:hypothetical protein
VNRRLVVGVPRGRVLPALPRALDDYLRHSRAPDGLTIRSR